jgi:hypothetical protein
VAKEGIPPQGASNSPTKAAFQCMLDDVLEAIFQRLEAGAKTGNLKPQELEMVCLSARRGMPRALKIKQALAHRGIVLQ